MASFFTGADIDNLHHFNSSYPYYGMGPGPVGPVGSALALAVTSLCVGFLLFVLLRFVAGTGPSQLFLHPVGGLLCFFGFPAVYSYISTSVWTIGQPEAVPGIVAPEFACASILFIVYHFRPFSAWAISFLMLLHYCFWVPVLWHGGATTIFFALPLGSLLLVVFPLCGIAWLLYLKSRGRVAIATESSAGFEKWMLPSSTVALILLGVLWLPGSGYSLARAKNPKSLTIEMSRSIPAYTIKINADGLAEYVGEQYVRDKGPHSVSLSQAQIREILTDLDRADFSRLEDRAFAWGYHSSQVGIKISVDGKTKEVWSDIRHTGSKTGDQLKFVQAAAEIDRIVGSDKWVNCDGRPCPI
jgi:Domain of unknown function (DUF6438)